MGGGTGTGAAPVVAQAAKEMGVLTVGVVTKPFSFEGAKRKRAAEAGLKSSSSMLTARITTSPTTVCLPLPPRRPLFSEMLQKANDVLYYVVKGISDVIVGEGLINLDLPTCVPPWRKLAWPRWAPASPLVKTAPARPPSAPS